MPNPDTNVNNSPKILRPGKKPADFARGASGKKPPGRQDSGRQDSNVAGSRASGDLVQAASRRKIHVFVSLVTVMTLTSALLWAVQTAPLAPDTSGSLSATDHPDDMIQVLATGKAIPVGRWKYVFIHHSQTPGGSAETLAADSGDPRGMSDHFVIGNGDGCKDGAVQFGAHWDEQEPAGRVPDVERMDPNCISICMIGDFDRAYPTPNQMKSLGQLVDVLQRRLHIDREHIWMVDAKGSPAGSGRYFPRAAFREQLLP